MITTKNVNHDQLTDEFLSLGYHISQCWNKNGETIITSNDCNEDKIIEIVNNHNPKPNISTIQKIDSINTIEDVKKFLKGAL